MESITLNNGTINFNGEKVGEAMKDFKYGYHPAVRVTLFKNGTNKWFELDEENLVEKIKEYVLSKM
jgi:hypothetical protein